MNNPFDISPDGKLLATAISEALTADIWLLSTGARKDGPRR